MRWHGFTLWEAFATMTVVFLFLAVFFPVFSHEEERASRRTCLSNQRQLATAILLYAQDHVDQFFPAGATPAWTERLELPTDATIDIFDCPALPGTGTARAPEYGFNANLLGVSQGAVKNPADLLLTADLAPVAMNGNFTITTAGDAADPHDYATAIQPRHFFTFVYCCLDGHAAVLTATPNSPVPEALSEANVVMTPEGVGGKP